MYAIDDVVGYGDTIHALFFGHRNSHRGRAADRAFVIPGGSGVIGDHLGGVARTLGNPCHIMNVNRYVVVRTNNQTADIVDGLEKRAGGHGKTGVAGLDTACLLLTVCGSYGFRHLIQANTVATQPLREHLYRNLFGTPPHDEAVAGIRNLFDAL